MKPLRKKSLALLGQWLVSRDTGVSSETIVAIAMGAMRTDETRFDAPHDPSDFGRCYRLVCAVPELRTHFPKVASMVPTFAGILENWDSLCELYLRDQPTGQSRDLYLQIKELRGDCSILPTLRAA